MKYIVVSPTFGAEDRDHGRCVRALAALGAPIMQLEDCPYIDMARAALVEKAFDAVPDLDVIVWLDHDIIFKAEDIPKFVERCIASEYDILAVMYSMRRPRFTSIGRPAKHVSQATFYQPGLVDADFSGMGMTAVKRRVFEKMRETLPYLECPTVGRHIHPYFHHSMEKGAYLGEDISFCYRAIDLGFKIGIDCEPRILHRGKYDYALEDCGMSVPDFKKLTINFDRGLRLEIEPT